MATCSQDECDNHNVKRLATNETRQSTPHCLAPETVRTVSALFIIYFETLSALHCSSFAVKVQIQTHKEFILRIKVGDSVQSQSNSKISTVYDSKFTQNSIHSKSLFSSFSLHKPSTECSPAFCILSGFCRWFLWLMTHQAHLLV